MMDAASPAPYPKAAPYADRFVEIVRQALVVPKARKKTRPSRASKEARLSEKKHRSAIKKMRSSRPED